MNRLDNKVALVTGSGRGLGRACAQIFARSGAKVVVADLNPDGGAETVDLIKNAGGEAHFVMADISKSSDVQTMVRTAIEVYGGLDCAINNAVRAMPRTPLAEIAEEDWDRTMAVNFRGVFLCMKYEILAMLEHGGGAIVNVGSGHELSSAPGVAWYLGAKHGMYGMTKVAALDYGKHGIRINAIGPGAMWTPALRSEEQNNLGHIDALARKIPMGRLADPAEVAEAAVWLCSDAASYVHGTTLTADGGAVLG